MKLRLIVIVFAFVLLLGVGFITRKTETKNNKTIAPVSDLGKICADNGGKWSEQYKECEGIGKNVCEENKGKYNSCASYCRHEVDSTKACIEICVELCSF